MERTVFISRMEKLWVVHDKNGTLSPACILKRTALDFAVEYISARPEGEIEMLKMEKAFGQYDVKWQLSDGFPPRKIILPNNKQPRKCSDSC